MPRSQRGQALIAIVVLFGIGLLAMVYGMTRPINQTAIDNKNTAEALGQAKAALIGWAVSNPVSPGSFPCPDLITNNPNEPNPNIPNDGIADDIQATDCPSYIGRLPWKTLGLPDLRDGSGERLWYALSPAFQNGARVNINTPGSLSIVSGVSGTTMASNVIAIIFAPGPLLAGQARDAADQNIVANYLDGENSNNDTTYASGSPTDSFNDQLLWITDSDLRGGLISRVAGDIRAALDTFHTDPTHLSTYPYAASDQSGSCPVNENDNGWIGVNPPPTAPPCPSPAQAPIYPSWISDAKWYEVIRYHWISADSIGLSFGLPCASSFVITWEPAQSRSTIRKDYPCVP